MPIWETTCHCCYLPWAAQDAIRQTQVEELRAATIAGKAASKGKYKGKQGQGKGNGDAKEKKEEDQSQAESKLKQRLGLQAPTVDVAKLYTRPRTNWQFPTPEATVENALKGDVAEEAAEI